MRVIREVSKKELKDFLYEIDKKDTQLYAEMNSNNGFGTFQFSGNTALGLVNDIHPENFEELVAINSLARPGTIAFAPEYNANKKGDRMKYPKVVNDLLLETRGLVLYQEQVMSIFNKIGNFTLEETNMIRGLMKKLGKADKKKEDLDNWDKQVNRFISGAIVNGITEKQAKEIANDLLMLSAYSFNKSHAVAYTFVALQTLYMSRYFRKYFYSATLSYEATKKDAIKDAYDNCRKFGFSILPPDVNRSKRHFSPIEGDNIVFGLNEIKNIGDKPIEAIMANRPYKSIIDFIMKNQGERISKTIVNSLIKSGAFDTIIGGERKLYEKISEDFFETKGTTKVVELLEKKWVESTERVLALGSFKTTNEDYVLYEKELLGSNFFHNNFSSEEIEKIDMLYKKGYIDKSFEDIKENKMISRIPVYVSKFRFHIDKNKNEMAFMEAEDMNNTKISFPIFASYWKFIKERFNGEGLYIFAFYRNQDDEIMFGSKKWLKDEEKTRLINSFKKKE